MIIASRAEPCPARAILRIASPELAEKPPASTAKTNTFISTLEDATGIIYSFNSHIMYLPWV